MNATRTLLIAAALIAPTAALAGADPFEGYERGLAGKTPAYTHGGAQGPAGPTLTAATACGHDPFDGYRRGFNSGGPGQLCGAGTGSQGGIQGPSGPTMATAWSDPFDGYRRGIGGH